MAISTPAFRIGDLAAELRELRKGRGVRLGYSTHRIGPTLHVICGISETDSPGQTVAKVVDWLRDKIAHLPPDLRISALAAYGLHEDVQLRFYHERVAWLAERLNRDPRTARRRIDEAIDDLANLAVQGGARLVGLRQYVDQPVRLVFSLSGIAEHDEMVWRCRVVAVAQELDNRDRHYAVVRLFDEDATTIAIPTTRIRRVAPIDDVARNQPARENLK